MRSATDVISWLQARLPMDLAMIDVSATGRKSLSCLAPGFLGTDIIVDIFQERGTKWMFNSHWKSEWKTDQAGQHKLVFVNDIWQHHFQLVYQDQSLLNDTAYHIHHYDYECEIRLY